MSIKFWPPAKPWLEDYRRLARVCLLNFGHQQNPNYVTTGSRQECINILKALAYWPWALNTWLQPNCESVFKISATSRILTTWLQAVGESVSRFWRPWHIDHGLRLHDYSPFARVSIKFRPPAKPWLREYRRLVRVCQDFEGIGILTMGSDYMTTA